ncbi:MAG: flagellar basal body P-ring protein FlgI [Phycisphaerales bacterium]
MKSAPITRPAKALALLCAALLAGGCSMMVERADPQMERASVDREAVKVANTDVDPIMRGTVAAETSLVGFTETAVRGYGLVVGLKGTGSRTMPADVRAYMMAELARRGFGSGDPKSPQVSPQQLLNSPDTAVVVVEGLIPPGAPKDSPFDVRVMVAPGTSTTSLEGGRLLMTDMRPGPLMTGSRQPFSLAEAKGSIVINPFVEPNATQRDSIDRTTGRIQDGGKVVKDMPLKLRLHTPSHSRAETIQNSINSLFPREPRQKEDTARGRSGDTIDLTVPPSYARKTAEFAELIRHAPINIENPEQVAMQVRRALQAYPGAAGAASWRWQALGKKSLPMIQDLYNYPEEQPRLAALDAGAKLDDQLAAPHLLDMAKNSKDLTYRVEAIKLLGRMGTNPEINIGLRDLLDDKEVDIRLAAFESLDKRRDPCIVAVEVGTKYLVNIVPCKYPMVYVTQSGQPRIAIFGEALSVARPMTLVAWNNRLIMKADDKDPLVQIYYRESADMPAVVDRARPGMLEFIGYLGRRPTIEHPEGGLGFSYSETIAALHELWRNKYLRSGTQLADFRAEQDRLLAALVRAGNGDDDKARSEFGEEDPDNPTPAPAPAGSLSELGASARSDLETVSRPGLDASKPRKDTVPR